MRRLLLLLASLGCMATSAHADDSLTLAGHTYRRVTPPAQSVTSTTHTTSAPASPWLNVGPNFFPGRFHCVTSDILNAPVVAAGADGSGYWWGYALADFTGNYQERGKELGGGVRQLTNRLNFPSGGGYYERASVIRTDGAMLNTIDDGVTWHPDTLNVPPGYSLGGARQLGYDSGSINVAYALVYGTDDVGNDGVAFLRSFDGGQVYDMTRFIPTKRAHMWTSREGNGQILLTWSDGVYTHIERNDGLGDDAYWHEAAAIYDVYENLDSDSLLIAAQEFTDPDSAHIWVHMDGVLFRTTDGGTSWARVQDYVTGSERSLGTSLIHPDLVMWTTGDYQAFYSTDGGVNATAFSTDWPSNDALHPIAGDIDCWKWNFQPTTSRYTVRLPSSDGRHAGASVTRTITPQAMRHAPDESHASAVGDQERIYFSGGGGVFSWQLEDPAPTLAARFGVVTQQISDLFTVRDGVDPYHLVTATRDAGIAGMVSYGQVPDNESWNFLITSTPLDIGHVVTSFKPDAGDPVMFGDFAFGGITTFGNNVFTGVGVDPGSARHPEIVADPVGPYRFWVASNALYRVTWTRATNSWATTTIASPISVSNQGLGFAIAPTNIFKWYLETADRKIYFSNNAGATWTLGTGVGPSANNATDLYTRIRVNPDNASDAWIVGAGGVLHTVNGGTSWTSVTTGLPAPIRAWDIALDPTPSRVPYLATEAGPFRWNGASWVDLAPAGGVVPAVPFRVVESVPFAGVMRFGTWGRGVWDYTTGVTTAVGSPGKATLQLAMRQNPVSDLARLDFTLPQAGRVTIELLDVQGRRVDTLLDRAQPAGPGSATLDATSLGAGVYFARLTSAQGQATARVVVLH